MVKEPTLSEFRGMRHTAGVILIAALKRILPRIEPLDITSDDVSFELRFFLDVPLPEEMLPEVEREMVAILREKPHIESSETLASNAAEYFSSLNQEILADSLRTIGEELIPVIRIGDLLFPCETPHELNPSLIGAIKLLAIEYDPETHLTSIRGTAFTDKKELRKFLKRYEIAKQCDHRLLAHQLQLFGIWNGEVGPEWFWLPRGAAIRSQLLAWWHAEINPKGFKAVSYLSDEDEFSVTHARIYAATEQSASDLPQRYCEIVENRRIPIQSCGLFETYAHRTDALSIFCRSDQVLNELRSLIEILMQIVSLFDLNYELRLSGQRRWLPELLQQLNLNYSESDEASSDETNLEVFCEDAIGRRWLGPRLTIHHNAPKQQRLVFQSADGDLRTPTQISASCFSSIERFTALLLEHFSGHLPLWLTPEQVRIIPLSERHIDYCEQVRNTIAHRHLRVEVDLSHETLSTRVFEAEIDCIPYVLVVGDQEEREGCITVRNSRLRTVTHGVSLATFLEQVQEEAGQRIVTHKHKPLRKAD